MRTTQNGTISDEMLAAMGKFALGHVVGQNQLQCDLGDLLDQSAMNAVVIEAGNHAGVKAWLNHGTWLIVTFETGGLDDDKRAEFIRQLKWDIRGMIASAIVARARR